MYLALYRKYRPRTFDEVISQKYITATLKNQVASGSAGHAYLFTGSRGTGKTSCAKILAMAVNCEDPQNGNPCLKCDRCREILDGTATDIVEMDAASNNGVDDVRTLRDEVAYTPVSCKYRVYIIDEVHMLSSQAFNALLKTLEEPPPHVKFILATTEVHKVLATIASRCQRFEFRRISTEESTERLLEVAEKEGVKLEKNAAELISRLSDGGMRDALSILDRCVSEGENITVETVRDCVGIPDDAYLFALAEMIAGHDTAGCIKLLNELHKGAKDISLIIGELSERYRDMMLYKTAPKNKELLNTLPDEQDKLCTIADMYTLDEILRCLTLLQQCADSIGRVKQRKTLAEMCFVRMCTGESSPAVQAETFKPAAAVQPITPAQTANSAKIEFREIDSEPARVTKKSESEMSALERARSARINSELQKTEKMVSSAAGSGAPVETSKASEVTQQKEPEKTAPVEITESKTEQTAASEITQQKEPEKAAPVEITEPKTEQTAASEVTQQKEPEKAAPVELTEPKTEQTVASEVTQQKEPEEAAPVELPEPPPAPPVSPNDDAAPPFDYGIPDPADYGEPPPEYSTYDVPPPKYDREFTEPAKDTGKQAAENVNSTEQPVVMDEESAANIAKLTQEQWNEAILKTGAFYSKMLENSTIKAEGDILVISTSNKTILNNVKGKEVTNYEKEISKALGFHVHLKFVPVKSNEKKSEVSPLQIFLDKCSENNIKVNVIE